MTGRPWGAATASAVCRHRSSGLEYTAATGNPASRCPAASACSRPLSDNPIPGRRPDRIGPVSSVTPCRTSTSVVNGGALAAVLAGPPARSVRLGAEARLRIAGSAIATAIVTGWRKERQFLGRAASRSGVRLPGYSGKERRFRRQPEKRRSSAATGNGGAGQPRAGDRAGGAGDLVDGVERDDLEGGIVTDAADQGVVERAGQDPSDAGDEPDRPLGFAGGGGEGRGAGGGQEAVGPDGGSLQQGQHAAPGGGVHLAGPQQPGVDAVPLEPVGAPPAVLVLVGTDHDPVGCVFASAHPAPHPQGGAGLVGPADDGDGAAREVAGQRHRRAVALEVGGGVHGLEGGLEGAQHPRRQPPQRCRRRDAAR